MNTPFRTYPKACFACEGKIEEPLEEFGVGSDVMCQSCWLEFLQGEPVNPFAAEDYYNKFLAAGKVEASNRIRAVIRKNTSKIEEA
jgi:hypothetical protein